MVPVNPPERSMWRRNKLWILPNTNTTVGTNTSASASNWADLQLLGTGSSGSDSNWAPGEEDASTSYSYNSTASFTTNGRQKRSSPPHASTSGYSFADKWGSPSKRSSPAGSPEGDGPGFKYWWVEVVCEHGRQCMLGAKLVGNHACHCLCFLLGMLEVHAADYKSMAKVLSRPVLPTSQV